MFYAQLEKLCKQRGITPTRVTVELGLSKGTMSNWKKGATPNGDVVVRFAEHFMVTTDYLLMGKENLETPVLNLKADETELLDNYGKLDSRGKYKLHTTIYEELDRMGVKKGIPTPRIPFAASGGGHLTLEQDEVIQNKLRMFEEDAKKLRGE